MYIHVLCIETTVLNYGNILMLSEIRSRIDVHRKHDQRVNVPDENRNLLFTEYHSMFSVLIFCELFRLVCMHVACWHNSYSVCVCDGDEKGG